jgi:hypothetical protein
VGSNHLNAVKAEVVLKDEGAGENGTKTRVVQKYSRPHPRAKLQSRRL